MNPRAAHRLRRPRRSGIAQGMFTALAVVGGLFFAIPLLVLVQRAPWGAMSSALAEAAVGSALWLSLTTSAAATVIAVVIGVPLAWVQARRTGVIVKVLRVVTALPIVLTPVVSGVVLLLVFGRNGVVGVWLDAWFGIVLPFGAAGVVLAQAFVAAPFLIITMDAAFSTNDRRYEEAARTMGASWPMVFRRVTLPAVRPALMAGIVLCWARALGEFGATITFAGNVPGATRTLPLAVFGELETGNADAAMALSVVLASMAVVVLVALRGRWIGAVT